MTEETIKTSDEAMEESPVEVSSQVEVEQPELQEAPASDEVTEDPVEVEIGEEEPSETDDDSPLVVEDGEGGEATVESVIEAVLFASDEPVSGTKLAGIVEQTSKHIRQAIKNLNQKYQEHGHAFRIEKIAGGWQMLTLPYYMTWLKRLVKVRGDSKLSPAALESLAIVAYKQPVIRADMEAIRGVACGEVLRSLMAKGLIKMVGRAEVVGRPMQYGTTKKFLEVFGLDSLKDLPTIEELRRPAPVEDLEPDEESDEIIEDTVANDESAIESSEPVVVNSTTEPHEVVNEAEEESFDVPDDENVELEEDEEKA